MAIVKTPNPLPSELTYVPPNSKEVKVKSGDSWWTLAETAEARAAGMTANDLCYFNYKTRTPAEINWYLYNKTGCRSTTKDGKNYIFTNADRPGVVYLPIAGPPPPVTEIPPPATREERTNTWFGIGGKAGTQFVVVGIETLVGYVASLDDMGKGMALGASINRVGPGFGASGGICLIYITGVKGPGELNGYQQGDGDFNLSLGGNWGKIAKSAGAIRKLQPLIEFITKLGVRSPKALKAALKAHPDKWIEMIKAGKTVKEFMGVDPNGAPNVMLIDLPIGGGVEASIFYGLANYDAMWDFTD